MCTHTFNSCSNKSKFVYGNWLHCLVSCLEKMHHSRQVYTQLMHVWGPHAKHHHPLVSLFQQTVVNFLMPWGLVEMTCCPSAWSCVIKPRVLCIVAGSVIRVLKDYIGVRRTGFTEALCGLLGCHVLAVPTIQEATFGGWIAQGKKWIEKRLWSTESKGLHNRSEE